MHWYIEAFRYCTDFKGIAHRRAFWTFILITTLVSVLTAVLEVLAGSPIWIDVLYSLISLLPFVAILVRRIRDTGLPLWSLLVVLVPGVGMIVLIYFLCLPSQPRAQLFT